MPLQNENVWKAALSLYGKCANNTGMRGQIFYKSHN